MPAKNLVRVILTAKDTPHRLSERKPLKLRPLVNADGASITLDLRPQFQEIEGFGGAFTEAAALVLKTLPPKAQAQLLKDYFDPKTGNGYTIGRIHINSCDFGSGNWACDEVPGDTDLKHFSIARDRQAIIPMLKAAQRLAGGKLKLFASPWSPPPWMKTNGEMNHGGKLKPKYRQTWANYYVRFLKEYAKAGVKVWGLTVQNEPLADQPFDSCIWTGEEERDFVRDYLGPTLRKGGFGGIKLMIWDHNRDLMYERAKVVFDDPKAAKYVWGTAYHWYMSDNFDNVRNVHDAWPDKKLLFTEGCVGGQKSLVETWEQGERYARSIVKDLNNWCAGWTDWNLILDTTGGPRHVPGPCSAPVLVDTKTHKVTKLSSFYYMGHFSKFIRPGARRIMCASTSDSLEATAFVNPDKSVACVALNRTDKAIPFALKLDGQMASTSLPAHSIMSLVLPRAG